MKKAVETVLRKSIFGGDFALFIKEGAESLGVSREEYFEAVAGLIKKDLQLYEDSRKEEGNHPEAFGC